MLAGRRLPIRGLRLSAELITSYLADSEWIGDKTPLTLCDVRVSPSNSVKPNIGASELSEALARVSFEGEDVTKPSSLIIDTELIRYKLLSYDGDYPEWPKLIPDNFGTFAHLDTVEAVKAVNSLKVLSFGKDYPIDLTIGEGKLVMANPDDKGQTELTADTTGDKVKVRIQGHYLDQAFRAFGGMVDFKLTNGYSPALFSSNGYRLVVMPMVTDEANAQAKKDREAKAEADKPKAKQKARTKELVKA